MNPSFIGFDPNTGTIKRLVVSKNRLKIKPSEISTQDFFSERPPPPAQTRVFNTRSGRPRASMRPKPTDYLAETLNKSHASDLTAPSPFLLRSNPFPLKFSSSRDLGIGNHSTWAQTVKEHAKLAPKVDPVKLGRESPIRNWDGEEPAFAHKSTVRFSATGVPSFEDQKWWLTAPSLPGQDSTVAQQRLSDHHNHTYSYSRRSLYPNGLPSFPDASVVSISRRRPTTAPALTNNGYGNDASGGLPAVARTSPARSSSPPFSFRRKKVPPSPLNFKVSDPIRQSESSWSLAKAKYYDHR